MCQPIRGPISDNQLFLTSNEMSKELPNEEWLSGFQKCTSMIPRAAK
jgi:hypothetical protein